MYEGYICLILSPNTPHKVLQTIIYTGRICLRTPFMTQFPLPNIVNLMMINSYDDTNFYIHTHNAQTNTRFPINLIIIRMKTRTLNHHLIIIILQPYGLQGYTMKHSINTTFNPISIYYLPR